MTIIRQSTVCTVLVGPVLDADGVAKTDEVVGNIRLSKNGGTPAAPGGAASLTHDHAGKYLLELIATNADTVGVLQISLNSGTNDMPVLTLNVVEEAVYDAFYAADAVGIPSIPNNWLTAAGIAGDAITDAKIAAAALNDKGNWNVGKAGYSLTAVTGLGNQTADITGTISTVTTLTTLPAITANWLTAAGIADNAITVDKIADNAISSTKIVAGDTGITLQKAMEMLAAFIAGQVSRSVVGGVTTLTYKKRDGTTTSFTAPCNTDDGDRDTTGALS